MRTSQEQHETERFRDFDRQLRKPLLRSHPSQLARTEGKPSTKYPKTYLVASRRQQCQLQQQLRRDSARTALPESLQALLQRQRSNGKWDPCDEITQLTNCCRLQPPEGYSYDWRWATALACVVLKRHPQYFEQLQEAYDRAVQWLEGHQLPLAEAHRRLPPTDSELYYTIPTGAIEKGNWREWTQLLLDTSGYTGFTAKEDAIDGMPEPRRKRLPGIVIDPAAADREQLQGLKLELLDAKCKVQHSFHKGERVECRWRRRDRLCRPQLERSWHTAVVTRTYEDGSADVTFDELRWEGEAERRVANCHLRKCCDSRGVGAAGSRGSSSAAASRSSHGDARGAAVAASKRQPQQHTTLGAETQEVFSSAASVLRHSWSAPLTLQQELARLQHVRQRRARPRPEFQVRSAAAAASAAGRQRSQRCHSPERKSRRAKADPPPPTTLLQLSACGTQQDSGGGGGGGGDDGGAALAEAEGRAVSAILAYESCLSAVRECLAETLAAASAPPPQSYTAQAARFERLRAMLGAGHTAQPGHSDWRQRDAPGLLLATVAAVEAVDAWARVAALSSGGARAKPLCWGGRPFLLGVPGHLDALSAAAARRLRDFYGHDFPTRRNPFCLCAALPACGSDGGGSGGGGGGSSMSSSGDGGAGKDIGSGEGAGFSSSSRSSVQPEAAALTDEDKIMWRRQQKVPPWWPCAGLELSLFARARRCECVLLREEALFPHWLESLRSEDSGR